MKFFLLIPLALLFVSIRKDQMIPVSQVATKTVYVVATAYDASGIESDYSDELMAPYTNNQLAVEWDPSPSTNVAGYMVYWGTNSGIYGWATNTGTNLTVRFAVGPVVPTTNYLRLFAQSATNATGPFQDASSSPFLSLTNVQTNGLSLFWRIRVAVSNAP